MMIMKTCLLLLHIALLGAIIYLSQSALLGTFGTILFALISVVSVPIISASALRLCFSLCIKKGYVVSR